MHYDARIMVQLTEEINRLSLDELDCVKRGLTHHVLLIQQTRRRLEYSLERVSHAGR